MRCSGPPGCLIETAFIVSPPCECFISRSHGDDWCLAHLQGTVIPLAYHQVTEPMRIVFVRELFEVVRATTLLPCQCCQGKREGKEQEMGKR